MEPQQIDHVAISVGDFDDRLALLTGSLGMTLKRVGTYGKDASRRIAMVGDAAGFKLEIIEGDGPDTFEHVAWRVEDVQASFDAMVAEGYTAERPPRRLDAAKAITALLHDPKGFAVQIIRYDADSPDL